MLQLTLYAKIVLPQKSGTMINKFVVMQLILDVKLA